MGTPVAHLLAIARQEKDLRFARVLAGMNAMNFVAATNSSKIRDHLIDHPQTIILLDGESAELVIQLEDVLTENSTPNRIFVVTDRPISEYPHVVATRAFGHHLFRRYERPAPLICSKLIAAALTPYPFGLLRFFPAGTTSQKIVLRKSGQKAAAVQAMQNYMQKIEVNSRLAALGAQALDELIMNAIFDAATENGIPSRRNMDRTTEFDLTDHDVVDVEVATAESYVGISVSDQFGSLRKEVVHHFLGLDYGGQAYVPTKTAGSGLGLHGMIQAGMSIIFVSKPGIRTEVMIFFPNVESFKDFRTGFRFISILSQ